ncbi:MAG: sensor histidine kinase [Halobacteriota archaeon]
MHAHDTALRVLLVEDNPGDAVLIKRLLTTPPTKHIVYGVDRLSAAIERCADGNVDVVLLDLGLPDSHGFATVATMRAEAPHVPIIVLTGLDDLELAVRAAREGAQDYLVKGTVTADMLERAIFYAVERKHLEEQLTQYSEHLEELVAQKTAELKRAERLAAVGQMAAMVGHDFRSPLQAILNTTYQGRKQVDLIDASLEPTEAPLTQQLRDGFDKLNEQVTYMNVMVTDLLDFAQTPKPKIVRVRVEQLVEDALRLVAAPANVAVERRLDPSLLAIDVDPFLMQRVLTNIIANACQAMPEGGTLSITTESNGQSASIEVRDSGIGIPPENLGKLFEPLFSTKSGGVGLGLAIVQSSIKAHGGSITVTSTVGRGATFYITLPLRG